MQKLTQTGVGTKDCLTVNDTQGTSLLPIQGKGDGATMYRVLGRCATDAPWVEIRAADKVDFLETISWVPEVRLEVTSGTGTVTLWIVEK